MRKLLLSVATALCALSAGAQGINERIAAAMNSSNWFALDSIYNSVPADSIDPFLESFSRCLIGNRLNRPEVSAPAFKQLLNAGAFDLGNLVASTFMLGQDLSRMGQYAEAAEIASAVLDQVGPQLDSITAEALGDVAGWYQALSDFKPYGLTFPADSSVVEVPFEIVPVGPPAKKSVLMHLRHSAINGNNADITFDTGAGVNIISPEMAARYNLIPLEGTKAKVGGVGKAPGYLAIAKEVALGPLTVSDVPFVVVPFNTGNEEADQYTSQFSIVLGSELMLQLKDITLDFLHNRLEIPAKAPARSGDAPNLCFSSSMNLLTRGSVLSQPMLMCIDSGDASFGSLPEVFYQRNREWIDKIGRPDTIRGAGLAGVNITPAYVLPPVALTLGNATVEPDGLVVKTAPEQGVSAGYDANIGLRSLLLFAKVRFNLVDFVVSALPRLADQGFNDSQPKVPTFKVVKNREMNLLEAAGYVGIGVARTLINPNAPANPDD